MTDAQLISMIREQIGEIMYDIARHEAAISELRTELIRSYDALEDLTGGVKRKGDD